VFKRFFGKKNDGFFLQIEDDTPKTQPAAKATPVAAPAPTVAAVAPVATEKVAAVATAATAKDDKQATKTEKKVAKKADEPKVAIAPALAPVITNFATDYLIKPSSISGRRRPGANMNGFLELARKVEKPKNFKATASERKAEK
jgi:hypothetical protein